MKKNATNLLFNKKHLKEYCIYGGIAGLLHVSTVWYFLYVSDYNSSPVLFIGSIFFMFTIMIYSLKLSGRRPEYKSTWTMLIAGHMAVAAGIFLSVLLSIVLCLYYLPNSLMRNAPGGLNRNNTGALELIFVTATMGNFGAGAFISAMIAYAIKPDQTKDQTPEIFEDSPKEDSL